MSEWQYGTWEQTILRCRLNAVDKFIMDYPKFVDKQIWQKRHEIIEKLLEVQLREWNYD